MSSTPGSVDIVIPVYGCIEALPELVDRIAASLAHEKFRILLVDDGSPDSAWSAIERIAGRDSRVVGFRLSRNFGQHAAIAAGLRETQADHVVVMDCDLQDAPEEIPALLQVARDGWHVVVGKRVQRQDRFVKQLASRAFSRTLSLLSGECIDPAVGNFGVYSRFCVNQLLELNESGQSFGLLVNWVGLPRATVPVKHASRLYGESTYSLRRSVKHAIEGITGHSDRLLRGIVVLGLAISMVAAFTAVVVTAMYFTTGGVPLGWTSLAILVSGSTGAILTVQGIVALYVARVFNETKGRPLYVIWQRT